MTTPNVQNLPAGLQGRAAAAASAPAPAPAPAPYIPPVDRGPVEQPPVTPAAPAPAPQVPAPAPVNPMLSHVSQPTDTPAPAPAPAAGEAPVVPVLAPVEVPTDKPADVLVQTSSVSELVGELAKDPNLSAAVSYLDGICTDSKVDMARAFGNAAEEGDARFIDRAYLKDVLGDKADAVIKTAEGVLAYTNEYAAQTVGAVHKLAGSEAAWDSAMAVYNEKASKEERQITSELMDSGVRHKVEHAAKQIMQFAVQAGGAIQHNAPAFGQPSTQQGMSKADYITAISARNISDAEYSKLRSLRALGKSQGLN